MNLTKLRLTTATLPVVVQHGQIIRLVATQVRAVIAPTPAGRNVLTRTTTIRFADVAETRLFEPRMSTTIAHKVTVQMMDAITSPRSNCLSASEPCHISVVI